MPRLTQEGFLRLEGQLQKDKAQLQRLAAEKSAAYSRDGDGTHDNPSFHLLSSEFEILEDKIARLETALKEVEIISESDINIDEIDVGTVVECFVSIPNKPDSHRAIQIVDTLEAAPLEGRISAQSPLGSVLTGSIVGDVCKLKIGDRVHSYKVLALKRTLDK